MSRERAEANELAALFASTWVTEIDKRVTAMEATIAELKQIVSGIGGGLDVQPEPEPTQEPLEWTYSPKYYGDGFPTWVSSPLFRIRLKEAGRFYGLTGTEKSPLYASFAEAAQWCEEHR